MRQRCPLKGRCCRFERQPTRFSRQRRPFLRRWTRFLRHATRFLRQGRPFEGHGWHLKRQRCRLGWKRQRRGWQSRHCARWRMAQKASKCYKNGHARRGWQHLRHAKEQKRPAKGQQRNKQGEARCATGTCGMGAGWRLGRSDPWACALGFLQSDLIRWYWALTQWHQALAATGFDTYQALDQQQAEPRIRINAFRQQKMSEFEGHIYLDHHYPPVLWNIVRGGFDSVDVLPNGEKDFAISVSLASMLQNSSANRLVAEVSLELVRKVFSPDSVSRLRGVFVFSDIDSISRIWDCNKWGGHFNNNYLADVGVWAKKSTRVDAAWIEDIIDSDGVLLPDWPSAAINYWSGKPKSESEPIWEVIVEGRFCIWSMHSKEEALKEIYAIWPNSVGLLVHSMNCFGLGSLDGQCFPGLLRTEEGVSLDHYIRMVDSQDSKFIEHLEKLPTENPKFFAGYPDSNEMHTPNLTGYSRLICAKNDAAFLCLLGALSVIQNNPPLAENSNLSENVASNHRPLRVPEHHCKIF